jgi:hypothetical protein
VERVEEPVRSFHTKGEMAAMAGERRDFGKVFIAGIGFMKDGRRLRDGSEKIDNPRLYRDRT